MADLARFRARFLAAFVTLAAILICGCAVPLAPGYQIKKEALAVHFVSGNPPHLSVHVEYTLANTGSTPLHFIDVALPSFTSFGSANFRAQINGNEVPFLAPSDVDAQMRIPLPSAWRQKQKLALAFSYDLAATSPADPRILLSSKMFLLNDSGWVPALLPYKAFLAPQISRPNRVDLSILVPASFRATASGQPRGVKKQNGELDYHFRIGKSDFDPYVIAGEYNEQRVSTSNDPVVLWTFASIPSAQAQQAAAQISSAASFLSQNFGSLPKSIRAIYDIEIPSGTSSSLKNAHLFAPPATIIDSSGDSRENSRLPAPALPAARSTAAEQLADTWFSHVIRPRADAWTLAPALSAYAVVQAQNPNSTSRSARITSAFADFSRMSSQAAEKPVLSLTHNDPAAQQELAAAKLQLFFAALEDKCGQQNLTHAIAHMVYALRGGEYGYPEFRSALEEQCHQNLAEFFRVWLTQPGIPLDFRARYGNSSSVK